MILNDILICSQIGVNCPITQLSSERLVLAAYGNRYRDPQPIFRFLPLELGEPCGRQRGGVKDTIRTQPTDVKKVWLIGLQRLKQHHRACMDLHQVLCVCDMVVQRGDFMGLLTVGVGLSLTLCLLFGPFSSYWAASSSLHRRVCAQPHYILLWCVHLIHMEACSFLKGNWEWCI